MIEIDGGQGEGGGQMVRSSLALSIISGLPVHLTNIRANRSSPGLKRQHLTCVQAAAAICDANVDGARLGAREIQFVPQQVKSGSYRFDIGSAGSTTLVAQTVMLPLAFADAASTVSITGGTYNTMAPPFDFLNQAYLPNVRKMGFQVEARQLRPGFYPRGGGEIQLTIESSSLKSLEILERGKRIAHRLVSIIGRLPDHIAETEIGTASRKLNWPKKESRTVKFDDCASPGNVLFAEMVYEHVSEIITEFGKQGLPADKVAGRLARSVKNYLKIDAPVGQHLADQLLLPMGIVAEKIGLSSCFRTGPLTQHSLTHIDILQRFLNVQVEVTEVDRQTQVIVKQKEDLAETS